MKVEHPIHMVAKRTGLSAHVIRAWEKRHAVVSPGRSGTNRRRYSEDDIERLRLLGLLTQSGHRIGDIANLPTETLRERVAESGAAPLAPPAPARSFQIADALPAAVETVSRMDAEAFGRILERSSIAFGQHGMLELLVGPLARRIGELWANGTLTAAHEHFASNELRSFLLRGSRAFAENTNAPLVIVTTPAGQLHELGAAIAAAAARDLGWRVLYLGPNLPAADIATAAVSNGARVIALSIVYPFDDSSLAAELALLRRLLPRDITIIAGGAAAKSYRVARGAAGIRAMDDLGEFSNHLTQMRSPPGI